MLLRGIDFRRPQCGGLAACVPLKLEKTRLYPWHSCGATCDKLQALTGLAILWVLARSCLQSDTARSSPKRGTGPRKKARSSYRATSCAATTPALRPVRLPCRYLRSLAAFADAQHDPPARAGDHRTPFDDTMFHFKDDRVVLSHNGDTRLLRIESTALRRPPVPHHQGHRRPPPRGLRRRRAPPAGRRRAAGARQTSACFRFRSFWSTHQFRYKGYSVMSPERPGLRPGAVWSKTCIFCHNTVPYLSTILGALAGPGTPPYQGEVVDPLLPDRAPQDLVITDEAALRSAVTDGAVLSRRRATSDSASRPSRRCGRSCSRGCAAPGGCFSSATWSKSASAASPVTAAAKSTSPTPATRPSLDAAQPLSAPSQPEPQNHAAAGQPRLRALPPGAVLALSVHLGGRTAQPGARRQQHQLGRGARLSARRRARAR